MSIQRARADMRWLILPDQQLNVFKYVGDMSGSTMTKRLRSFFSVNPQAISHSSLNDLREFTGSITYQDMVGMAAMMRSFRTPSVKRKSILLTRDHAAVYIARLAQDIFHTSIEIHAEPDQAFMAAANGMTMPDAVRQFLDGGR